MVPGFVRINQRTFMGRNAEYMLKQRSEPGLLSMDSSLAAGIARKPGSRRILTTVFTPLYDRREWERAAS
jgi:hypothetical protein